jgi:hypothetical protein
MAGDGEVIPNGSIHWNMNHDNGNAGPYNTYTVQGVDPTPVADIRKGKDHPGDFRVTLRFNNGTQAQAAFGEVRDYVERSAQSTGVVEVVLYVPANTSVALADASGPSPNPNAQIRVEW